MRETRAQVVMLIRAFEEADHACRVLPAHSRVEATRRALMVTGLGSGRADLRTAEMIRDGEVVLRRARLLFEPLTRRVPSLFHVLRLATLGSGTAPTVVLGALLCGAAAATLPPRGFVSVLPAALLAAVAWNLVAFGLLAWRGVRGPARDLSPAARIGGLRIPRSGLLPRSLAALFLRGAIWRRRYVRRVARASDPEVSRVIDKAIIRFGALWHRVATPLLESRVRYTLHAGAIAFVAGVVGGQALAVRPLHLGVALPAWLRDGPLADAVAPALRGLAAAANVPFPDGTTAVPIEPWLLFHAAIAGLLVALPRIALIAFEVRRAFRLRDALPLEIDVDDPYFQRMFAAWDGVRSDAVIAGYDLFLRPRAAAGLKTLMHHFLGARATVRIEPMVRRAAGRDDLERVMPAPGPAHMLVTVIDPTRPPDDVADGELLDRLRQLAAERETRLLLVLDRSVARPADEPSLAAWRALVAARGLRAVELDLERSTSDDDTLQAVGEGVWPRRPAA